jgi:hypothetical protein
MLYENHYIYFSAWIEESQIKPYFDFKDQLIKSNKSGAFKDALQAIEDFIKSSGDVSTYFTFLFKLLVSFVFLSHLPDTSLGCQEIRVTDAIR